MTREPDFVDECYAGKDLSLLKKLTLVIPTYNRNYYLSRCLWYHAHFPFGEIIVADSSPEEKKVVNRETVVKVREMFGANVRYLEYEPETEKYGGDIYRKWGDAVQHVDTEYSQFLGDKEFIIPTSTVTSISYLSKHDDYVCVSHMRGSIIRELHHYNTIIPYCLAPSYDSQTICERFQKYVDIHISEHLFSTYITKIHKIIFQNLELYGINDLRYGEVALEVQPLFLGKIKQMMCVGRVRDLLSLYSGILCNKNLKNSSNLQYPTVKDYPSEFRSHLLSSFKYCLLSLSGVDIKDTNIISNGSDAILGAWFGENSRGIINDQKRWYRVIRSFLPRRVLYTISLLLNVDSVVDPSLINTSSKELQTILKIVSQVSSDLTNRYI